MCNLNEQIKCIEMDRNAVVEFIKQHWNDKERVGEIEEALIEVILHIIPVLGHYEEEGEKINFSIAIGNKAVPDALKANFRVLHSYKWESEDNANKIKIIERMIKRVAIFCRKDANIFLIADKCGIKCGIYWAQLFAIEQSESNLLDKGFIIFEHLYNNRVIVSAAKEQLHICMDFGQNPVTKYDSDADNISQKFIYRKWKGIFERVKRTVHGTICIFVDSEWTQEDDNFNSIIELSDLNLRISGNPSADEIQNFNNQLDIFIEMLNYDGITIIDTEENIRAYNVLYKNSGKNKVDITGGARHMTYECLKNLEPQMRKGYVAVYFQSQEGEIEFYKYENDEREPQNAEITDAKVEQGDMKQNPRCCFDASIMCTKRAEENAQYDEIKKKYEENEKKCLFKFGNLETEDFESCVKLYSLAKELDEAHSGIDNFYKEPVKAVELKEYIYNHKDKVNKMLGQYSELRIYLLNIVFRCFIGTAAGYAWYAEEDLKKIMAAIGEEIYIKYFDGEEYLDKQLLWSVTSSHVNARWEKIVDIITNKYSDIESIVKGKKYSCREFHEMYDALIDDEC